MVCIPGQRRPPHVTTVTSMTLEEMKISVVIAWALVWGVIAVSLVSSASSWFVLAGSGVLPPLMILWMWQRAARIAPAVIRVARS